MTTTQETFQKTVLEPLKVNVGTHSFSYLEYLKLPASQRSHDEADVVDSRFTTNMRECLGVHSGIGRKRIACCLCRQTSCPHNTRKIAETRTQDRGFAR